MDSKPPSIDTALHALLPFKHIDHLHPDSLISIAASKNSEKLTQEIWDNEMGWVPWQRPGFDLALNLEKVFKKQSKYKGYCSWWTWSIYVGRKFLRMLCK